MPPTLRLKAWTPGGECLQAELPSDSDIRPTLTAWAKACGCPVGDLDYQINDGLRVLGEASALARQIDVCGLPRNS